MIASEEIFCSACATQSARLEPSSPQGRSFTSSGVRATHPVSPPTQRFGWLGVLEESTQTKPTAGFVGAVGE